MLQTATGRRPKKLGLGGIGTNLFKSGLEPNRRLEARLCVTTQIKKILLSKTKLFEKTKLSKKAKKQTF